MAEPAAYFKRPNDWPNGGGGVMAMARAYLRATHRPVALVFTADRRFSVIVTGTDIGFVGGLNVSHAAEALLADSTDLGPFRQLDAAFHRQVD